MGLATDTPVEFSRRVEAIPIKIDLHHPNFRFLIAPRAPRALAVSSLRITLPSLEIAARAKGAVWERGGSSAKTPPLRVVHLGRSTYHATSGRGYKSIGILDG